MEQFLFATFGLITCGGALAVVFSQNIVRMAFYLVIALGGTAGLFFLLNADFVAATQLLIYVGGTVVLLIFGVMLTSSSPFSSLKTTPAEMLQSGFLGLALFAMIAATVLNVDWKKADQTLAVTGESRMTTGYNPAAEGESSRRIGTALLGVRFDKDFDPSQPRLGTPTRDGATPFPPVGHDGQQLTPSRSLSTGYLLVFEIISLHLLVVLIGAAYLARAKRTRMSVETLDGAEA